MEDEGMWAWSQVILSVSEIEQGLVSNIFYKSLLAFIKK